MPVILVTGGSGGLGLATVQRLAASGDRVFYGWSRYARAFEGIRQAGEERVRKAGAGELAGLPRDGVLRLGGGGAGEAAT